MKKYILILAVFLSSLTFSLNNKNNISLKEFKTKKILKLNELKRPLYIKVWATWCHYCMNSMDKLDILSSMKNLDYDVISVVFADGKTDVNKKEFYEMWKYDLSIYKNIKVYFDINKEFIKKIKVKAYPTNVFIDSKGNIKKIITGVINNYEINNIMKNLK